MDKMLDLKTLKKPFDVNIQKKLRSVHARTLTFICFVCKVCKKIVHVDIFCYHYIHSTTVLQWAFLTLYKGVVIHNPTMHNSCIDYPNKLELCRKSYKIMQLEHYILLNKRMNIIA